MPGWAALCHTRTDRPRGGAGGVLRHGAASVAVSWGVVTPVLAGSALRNPAANEDLNWFASACAEPVQYHDADIVLFVVAGWPACMQTRFPGV
jgi:hypothetical protein